jgi:hypothetical protein
VLKDAAMLDILLRAGVLWLVCVKEACMRGLRVAKSTAWVRELVEACNDRVKAIRQERRARLGVLMPAFLAFVFFASTTLVHGRLIPVTPGVNLTGVTTVNGVKKISVGQKIAANVVCGTMPMAQPDGTVTGWTFQWTISDGDPFADYFASASWASKADIVFENKPSLSWYFRVPANATVTCVVTPPAPAEQFSVSATVSV